MPDFITLSCPSCGHKLQITSDIDRFACAACGNEHIVNRSGGIVTLKPVIEGITKVQIGVDKTASELAINRLERELAELEKEYSELWDKRAKLAIWKVSAYKDLTGQLDNLMSVARKKNAEIEKHKKIVNSSLY
jgi:hypothetical protein